MGFFGFPHAEFETVRARTPATEGSTASGTTSGGTYTAFKTEFELLQSVSLAGFYIKTVAAATYTLYLLDAWDLVLTQSLPYVQGSSAISTVYFGFQRQVFAPAGGVLRIELVPSVAAKIRYTATNFSGAVFQETNHWLSGASISNHMILQLACAKRGAKVWVKYW